MGFVEWVKREWHVVEGNAKWDFYKWVFAIAGAAVVGLGAYLIHKLRYGPEWLPYGVGFALALFILFWASSKLTVLPISTPAQSAKQPVLVAPEEVVREARPILNPNDPDLRAEIQEVLFHLERLPVSNDIFILMRVSVVNHGAGEAVVTQWDLEVEVGDVRIECREEEIPSSWRIRKINPTGRVKITTDEINRDGSAFREPLRKGVPKERWVCFKVFTLVRILPPHNAKFILTLTDAFGHMHAHESGPGFAYDIGEIVVGE